jgi:hypothetical protein
MWNTVIDKTGIDIFNNTEYFDVVERINDDYGSTVLFKVRENLSPKYTIPEINWSVTVAGYLISILGFLGFAYISTPKKGIGGKLWS